MAREAVLVVVMVGCMLVGVDGQLQDKALAAVARGNNVFSSKLYKELIKTSDNVFFSPLSVEVVLALAWLGAGGLTASQIAEGLSLPPSREQVEAGFKAIMTHLQSTDPKDLTLDIANKIYAQKGFEILEDFRRSAEQSFLSAAEEVDFGKHPEEARRTVNQWVEQKTRNRIKDLLPEGSIDDSTIMVLVNAIYFKGEWVTAFEKTLTKEKPFHVKGQTTTDVQMMHIQDNFLYAELPHLQAKAVELPYKGHGFSMLILLPNDIGGLSQLESRLDQLDLDNVTRSLHSREVILSLPRFKLEQSMELNKPLKNLGMTSMFDNTANFSGLAREVIKVSKVIQKSFVEVNEEGSEAAAATGVIFAVATSLITYSPPPPAVFNAEHPFIFYIMDSRSRALLFMGRVVTPQ